MKSKIEKTLSPPFVNLTPIYQIVILIPCTLYDRKESKTYVILPNVRVVNDGLSFILFSFSFMFFYFILSFLFFFLF